MYIVVWRSCTVFVKVWQKCFTQWLYKEKKGMLDLIDFQETGDRRQETGDRRQETGDRRQETGDRRQETGDRRQEILGNTVPWFPHPSPLRERLG